MLINNSQIYAIRRLSLSKKRIMSRAMILLFILILLAFSNNTMVIPDGMITFDAFEAHENYLIGQNYIKEGLFPATLLDAYIVNEQGEIINDENLPFEYHFWVAENPSYGAIIVDDLELLRIKKHAVTGYKLKGRAFAIVMHLIPKSHQINHSKYYLKLDYKVLGYKKQITRCLMKSFTLTDES